MMTGPVACGFGIKGSATDIGIVVPKNLEITMNMMFTKIISVLHSKFHFSNRVQIVKAASFLYVIVDTAW